MTAYPKAVIFDLDGCLVDSEPLSIGAIAAEMRAMGVSDASFQDIRDQFLGVSMHKISEYAATRMGSVVDQGFIDRVEARIFEDYRSKLRRTDGALPMLVELKANGVVVAIATGGSIRRMHKTLELSGLADLFEGKAFSADQVKRGKPAPDLFLYAARQIGMQPRDCVVLEDSPHGVEGAVAAGMRAVGFVGGTHLDGIRADHTELLKSKGAATVARSLEDAMRAFFGLRGCGELIDLNNASLANLPDNVLRPNYDRSALTAGIVHIGLGNFHRAHQAWYLHRLMQQGLAQDWAIIGAGIRPYDEEMRQKLKAQDYLTTLIELDPKASSVEIVGSMIGYLPVQDGNGALITQMADPAIRIVSLTITEGGYFMDAATGTFDASHPDIVHDAANPAAPRTAFGAIVAALKLRRERGVGPMTCQSCDNLQGNGAVLRDVVVSLARLSDPELGDWISENCTFPNSMVDCIVPATGPKERDLVREFGIDDAVPVTHENFRQWVIEDHFCAGRPDWNKVGATFSDNVHGYEAQKIRILNAGHQVIANSAEILGIETVSAIMAHPSLHAFLRKVALDEIVPHVIPVPGMTPTQYVEVIDSRFSNPAVVDTTRRIAFDGSSRHPGFVLPTVRDALAAGASVSGLALVEAAWARMCEGTRENGSLIEPNDPYWDDLSANAKAAKNMPLRWLKMRQIYGELAERPQFADAFSEWLNLIYADGMEAAIVCYLRGK